MVAPYEESSVSADKPPSQWKLKHDYGGNRVPIRLQVFLHAAGCVGSDGKQFGNYKEAATLDPKDDAWLHPHEVLHPHGCLFPLAACCCASECCKHSAVL